MRKRLLVTGISGFLGHHIATTSQDRWHIIGLYNEHRPESASIESLQCDLDADPEALGSLISTIRPDAILHLAARSDPNACERDPVASYRTNVQTTRRLAGHAQAQDAYFLFVSSDQVFDGTAAPYDEYQPVHPINTYGKQKAEAEAFVLGLGSKAAVARLPLMYGMSAAADTFFTQWLRRLRSGGEVHAFTDEYRSVVSGRAAAKGLFLLLDETVEGVWHLGGKERVSRYAFAMMMAERFHLSSEPIVPSSQQDLDYTKPGVARRTPDVSLDSSKAFSLGYDPKLMRDEMSQMYQLYRQSRQ